MSQIPAEVRERIVAAANELYEELGYRASTILAGSASITLAG